MILFDTSVLSQVFRRRQSGQEERRLQRIVEELMYGGTPLGIPGIVLQEVLSGIHSEKQFAKLADQLLAAFTIILPSATDHIEAAQMRNRCMAKGLSVSGPDCLIAAMAISGEYMLFTSDNDFKVLSKHTPLKLFSNYSGGGFRLLGCRKSCAITRNSERLNGPTSLRPLDPVNAKHG